MNISENFKRFASGVMTLFGPFDDIAKAKLAIEKKKVSFGGGVAPEHKAAILEYLDIICGIPEMAKLMPDMRKVYFEVDDCGPGVAGYSYDTGKITINPSLFRSGDKARKLGNTATLAHELCHASQKRDGLYFNDMASPSFAETYRIAKLMEAETRLFDAKVQRYLSSLPEFKDVPPTPPLEYYNGLIAGGDPDVPEAERVRNANLEFVKTYWQNGRGFDLSPEMRIFVDANYKSYSNQAFHHAVIVHEPKFNRNHPSGKSGGVEAKRIASEYCARMDLPRDPALTYYFLTDGSDNAEVNGHSIKYLNPDGSESFTIKPLENNPVVDHLIFPGRNGSPIEEFRTPSGKSIPDPRIPATGLGKPEFIFKTKVFDPEPMPAKPMSPNEKEELKLMLLMLAMDTNNLEEIESILKERPSIVNGQTSVFKNFPVMNAMRNGNDDALKILMKHNPNLLLKTEKGDTVLNHLDRIKDPKLKKQVENLHAAQMKKASGKDKGR